MLSLTFVEGEAPPDASTGREVNTWCDEHGEVCARGFVGSSSRWLDCPDLAVFAFEARSSVVRAWAAAGTSRDEVAARFTRILQPAILQAMGWQALHASAIAGDAGAIALCGVTGSGKSTIAYALGREGFTQMADDGVVIRVTGSEVFGHPLPFVPRLRADALGRLGAPSADVKSAGGFGAARPLRAIVLLQRDARHPPAAEITRVRPAAAFSALVSHAHCFDPASPADARRFADEYLSIVAGVPVHALNYRGGLDGLAAVVDVVRALALEHGVNPAQRPVLVPAVR
jgi:hypothetical protein